MSVHNMMEQLVEDCLREYLQRHPAIATKLNKDGRSDVKAIVLNSLPSKYVSTAKGEVFMKTQLRKQHESDVFRELPLALDKVLGPQRERDF